MNELVQILKNTRQHLMTGVSHMIPFVVSGGILLAVSVMLYGKGAVPDAVADPNLKKLFDIGVAGLTLMVPFLAAYIGYSIAERSALAPCAIGAWVGINKLTFQHNFQPWKIDLIRKIGHRAVAAGKVNLAQGQRAVDQAGEQVADVVIHVIPLGM